MNVRKKSEKGKKKVRSSGELKKKGGKLAPLLLRKRKKKKRELQLLRVTAEAFVGGAAPIIIIRCFISPVTQRTCKALDPPRVYIFWSVCQRERAQGQRDGCR